MRQHLTLFVLIFSAAVAIFFFSNIGKVPPVEDFEVAEGRVTYQDENVLFDYPEDLESRPIDDGRVLIGEQGVIKRDSFYFKVYEQQTSFRSFDAFVQNERARFQEYANGSELVDGEDYSFIEEDFNGFPVLLHTRSFGGMSGNASDMYVWLGRGKVYLFSSESDYERLRPIYETVRPAS
jgi:hypothetical protein